MKSPDSNVNVGDVLGSHLPCILCAQKLPIKADKNGKPYCVCRDCGIQLFIRGVTGRERLRSLLARLRENRRMVESFSREFLQFQASLAEIENLRTELKAAKDKIAPFFADPKDVNVRDAIEKLLNRKIAELQEMATETQKRK